MRKFLTFLTLLTLSIGVGWAAESVFYTLTPATGSNNNYGSNCDVAIGGITWNVTGNAQMTPWRIGGKSLTKVDRAVYSKTAMGSAISKVELTVGDASSITVNSLKLTVASDANFNNVIEVVTKTFAANSTITFTPTSGEWVTGAYYKFTFNVTVSGTKNKFVEFNGATFYKNDGGQQTVATPTFNPAEGTYYEAQNVTISCGTSGATIHYTTDGNTPTANSATYSSAIPVSSTTTIKAIAVKSGMTNSEVASATYTIFTPETVTPTYEESFAGTFGKFYKRDVTGTNIWTTNSSYAKASGYISGSSTASESRLISPYIDLTDASNPELSFSHAGNFFTNTANMQSDVAVKVKKQGDATWSDLTVNTWPDGTSWTFVDNTTSLADYAGEIIQIAFVYTSSTSRAGTWEIKNFKVKNVDASAPTYYLVGSFNNWQASDDYKFEENNGTFTLDNVSLPTNAQFKIIKVDNGTITWYGGIGDVVYNIHHTHHTDLPMNGSQNYKIQSAGVTSFSFTVNDNTPSNLNVNRTASLAIKGDFTDNWTEVPMTATSNGWTTTQTIAANNQFGFVDEFGQFRGKEWTILSEHMNGYEIPMETNGNYKMGIAGSYTLNVNSGLTTLVVNDQSQSSGDEFELVTDASTLNAGDYVIITNSMTAGDAVAMGADRGNNRGTADVTISSDIKITPGTDVQILTLEGDASCWYFNTGNDTYLRADGGSSSNHLKTGAMSDNAKASITSGSGNTAEIVFQISGNRKYLRYNSTNNPPIFSCYESGKQSAVYLFRKPGSAPAPKAATPTFSPAGGPYDAAQSVTISCETPGATIYYKYGNSTPAISSENQYDGPITVNSSCTITAIAVADGYRNSDPATVTYTINLPQVATPTFSPEAGAYNEAQSVTISCETTGATIYYTTDGSTPSTSSTEYTGAITVSETMTIKAIAVATGYGNSEVATAAYTIDTTIPTTGDYAKVTSTDDLEDGDYLIVYEDNLVAFNGALETLDAAENTVDIVIAADGKIVSNATVDAAVFTWDSEAGTLKSASGYYIGRTAESNGLDSDQSTVYTNTITFDESGNAVITAAGECTLRFNSASNQLRFRYYKSGQQPIQLYKVSSHSVATPVITPGSKVMTEAIDATITCATQGATIYYTLDGTTPTTSSAVYSEAIHIAEPAVTLQAIAVKDGQSSAVAEAVYSGVWVENIAEYNALAKGTTNIVFKNPVTVQYHYISSTKNYIYVKDESGCAYFHQPKSVSEIAQLQNGDIIGAGFYGDKVADEMVSDEESHFFMLTNLVNFAPNGDKGLADPEHETVAHIIDATTGVALNNHYITIKKVKLSELYLPYDVYGEGAPDYGGAKYFDIFDETGQTGQHYIGFNKFNIDYSVVDDLDAYYDITGIQTAYNNKMEFHPTEIVKWEETVVTLRQLCDEGVTTDGENEYTISNNLMCVYAKDNSIWVKDDTGQSIWMTEPGENEQNYEIEIADNTRPNQAYYDQSNWCEIVLTSGDASSFKDKIIKGGSIHGSFVDKTNPKMTGVTLTSDDISSDGEYDPNYYVPANFFGTQSCQGPMNHGTFFFMNPKPQEYARIAVAVYDGTKMVLPKGTATDNQGNTIEVNGHNFQGSFSVDMSMNGSSVTLERGSYYTDFEAIIRLKSADSGNDAPMRKAAPTGYEYEVFPLSIVGGGVLTGVETIAVKDASREVVATEYYNVAGQRSDRPVEGINIVVTRYSDGSTSTAKVLK